MAYSVGENMGKVNIEVVRGTEETKEFKVGIRTQELGGKEGAKEGQDFQGIDQIITFGVGENKKRIPITIIEDEVIESDEVFEVLLCDPVTKKQLVGEDTKCLVTIVDNDWAGALEFEKKQITVSTNNAYVKVVRKNGCAGKLSCNWGTEEISDDAKAGINFVSAQGILTFNSHETEKIINLQIIEKNELQREDQFRIKLWDDNMGSTLGTRVNCIATIITSKEFKATFGRLEKVIELAAAEKEITYGMQFKRAVMLSATVDENGIIDDVTACEAIAHLLTIGWKIIFAFVPPARIGGGWPTFCVALCFIGVITAIVGELANLLGCVIGMSVGVTAITFVAMGTSLPDTFASKQAAQESEYADAAIGNVTGSNSVNVFLGLGLPYLIAGFYYDSRNETYHMPAGDLAFSVIIYLICSALCVLLLIIRRAVVGGELGGSPSGKYFSAGFSILLWVIFVTLVSLKFEKIL